MSKNKKPAAEEQIYPPVRCPHCGWRLMDRTSHTDGVIEIKCKRCRDIVKVDIAWRHARGGLRDRISAWY